MDDGEKKGSGPNRGVYSISKPTESTRLPPKKSSKYGPALRHLLPWRPPRKDKSSMPANKSGMVSFVTINWLNRLMLKSYRKGLSQDDIYKLAAPDRTVDTANRMSRIWEDHVRRHGDKSSLFNATVSFIMTRFIVAMVFFALSTVLQFVGPSYIQKYILNFVDDPSQTLEWGIGLVALLFLTQLARNFCFGGAYVLNMHSATRVQGALQRLVFSKVLRLRASDERALGQVITFCSSEQERIFDAIHMGSMLVSTPVMFILSVYYSYSEMGVWALIGNFVILCFYPIMGVVAGITTSVRTRTVKLTDKRVGMMGEILNSIKFIKMYAWEESFARNLHGIRQKERKELQTAGFLQSFSNTISPSITILATVMTFIAYTLAGNDLYSTQAFTVFSAFTALQFTVAVLPFGIKTVSESRVAFKKIEKILLKPECHPPTVSLNESNANAPIVEIKDASFVWEDVDEGMTFDNKGFEGDQENGKSKNNGTSHPKNGSASAARNGKQTEYTEALKDVSLRIERGQLIGICGSVGSGKSSLLSTITGDMNRVRGDMAVRGNQALVTQQAWIFNDTLRENILFGLPYEEKRYKEVVGVCSLKRDFELLANGDLTEIGERGSNLSGGQKQRVNLARAVYANKDIYLLDDPLSAVDSRVAKHIFNKCIKSYLKDKTVLLVTHGIQFLEECDQVLFMKDGRISECGTSQELSTAGGGYTQMLSFDQTREKKKKDEKEEEEPKDLDEEPPIGGGTLTAAEEHTPLGIKAYLRYFQFAGGYVAAFVLLVLVILFTLASLFSSLWLQEWLDAGDGRKEERERNMTLYNQNFTKQELTGSVSQNPDLHMYQLVYGLSFVVIIVVGVLKGWGFAFHLVRAASRMHDTMFRKIMRCPVAFFDVTPAGRVLQRFSKDMDELDVRVPYYLEYVLQGVLNCLGQMVLICIMFPFYTIVLVVALVIFSLLEVWLKEGLSQTKTIDNIRRAPVISHISSAMAGVSVIRAYGQQGEQLQRFCDRVDHSLSSDLIYRSSVRWFTFRMDMLCVLLVTLTGLSTVLMRGSSSAAQSGLALSSVFAVCNIIPYVMQMASEMQARFTSVERVLEYTSDLPEEAPLERRESPKPPVWPERGEIVMENVELRYRPGLPLVLQKVNASVRPGEKVGVVGRTGAGKSSLISTLLRFTELAGGRILVDDVDISQLGLRELRSGIAIIPQDPVLFEGTMRFNLDPFGDYDDSKIWEALEKSHVKEKVSREEKQLLTEISGGGQNLSVGEKQLICLARAVLRRNKILLLDEATASVDVETDFLIQRTIREAFDDCTVLTIAHRLHTVATYDRVMVMDAGKVIEFDTPAALLAREGSVFRQMSEAAGVSTSGSAP